jgi:membrane-associated phospholipid phosphatase
MNLWKYNHPGNRLFTWMIVLFVITGAWMLSYFSRDTLFFSLNQRHSYLADLFFSYFTHIGDGLFMIGLGVVLLGLGKRKMGVMLILSFLLSGLIVQMGKRLKPEPRPGKYYAEINQIHRVEDQPLKGNNSFPSGHTTTAFAMFSLLSFSIKRNLLLESVFFLLALFVAYSRIYLGHHFFKDVYAGAILGYVCSLLIVWLFRNKNF